MPLLPETGSSGYRFPADPIGTPKRFVIPRLKSFVKRICESELPQIRGNGREKRFFIHYHQPLNTFMTSSPEWLITLTPM